MKNHYITSYYFMKILYILLLTITFSLNSFAQNGFQDRASAVSQEMTMVLGLDKETSKKIYHAQLRRYIEAQKIRTEFKENPKQMRAELRKLQNRLWGKLTAILGEEKMRSWSMHKKSKV